MFVWLRDIFLCAIVDAVSILEKKISGKGLRRINPSAL